MNIWQKLQARTLLSRAHSSSFSSAMARRTASNDSQLYSAQLQCRANRELRDPVIKWLGRWSRDSTASRSSSTVSSSTNHRITSCFYTSALHWFFTARRYASVLYAVVLWPSVRKQLYLLLLLLLLLVFHHPLSLSHTRLKTFLFCKSFPLQSFFFFFRTDYMDFPDFYCYFWAYRFLLFSFSVLHF